MSAVLCGCCGGAIAPDVLGAQREHGDFREGGADCRDCLEDVPTSPQMTDLLATIGEHLDGERREQWDGADLESRVLLAMHVLNAGIVEGGTLGFTEQLRKYGCLLLLDMATEAEADALDRGDKVRVLEDGEQLVAGTVEATHTEWGRVGVTIQDGDGEGWTVWQEQGRTFHRLE